MYSVSFNRVVCPLVLLLAPLLAGCPQPDIPEPEPAPPLPAEDYFPLAVGNEWHWDLVMTSPSGNTVSASVALAITDSLVVGDYTAWRVQIEAPWYMLLPLRWILNGEEGGYFVRVEDSYYFTTDASLLAALPDVTSLTKVPVEVDIRPRIVEAEWNGKSFFVKYQHGTLVDFLPETAELERFGVDTAGFSDVVATSTSQNGQDWRNARVLLVRGIGPVFCSTDAGLVYLQQAVLQTGEDEATSPADETPEGDAAP